jgi:hypothetical protein
MRGNGRAGHDGQSDHDADDFCSNRYGWRWCDLLAGVSGRSRRLAPAHNRTTKLGGTASKRRSPIEGVFPVLPILCPLPRAFTDKLFHCTVRGLISDHPHALATLRGAPRRAVG